MSRTSCISMDFIKSSHCFTPIIAELHGNGKFSEWNAIDRTSHYCFLWTIKAKIIRLLSFPVYISVYDHYLIPTNYVTYSMPSSGGAIVPVRSNVWLIVCLTTCFIIAITYVTTHERAESRSTSKVGISTTKNRISTIHSNTIYIHTP